MKKVTLWKTEKGIVKERSFIALEIEYKDKYVIFTLKNGEKQVISNFENFREEKI